MIDKQTLDRVQDFHGHMCPGLAMGIRAAEIALERIGPHAGDEEVVAIVETDMCGVDAVQVLTGCTFGKGNLIHRDYGKNAYTFGRRSDGHVIRVITKPDGWGERDLAWEELFAKVRAHTASTAERAEFHQRHVDRAMRVLAAPIDDLYDVVANDSFALPHPARIHTSVSCAHCGEATMETRVRMLHGDHLCIPCFESALAGHAPLPNPAIGVGRR